MSSDLSKSGRSYSKPVSTESRDRLPDFVLIGAMKCGTTYFSCLAGQHPEIFLSTEEPRFFHSDERYAKGLDAYREWFEERNAFEMPIIGEGSGFYAWRSWNERTAHRIARDLPGVRIIYMVRHPLDRIVSHYKWDLSRGKTGSLSQALKTRRELIEMSCYMDQIDHYRKFVPDDRIHVIFFHDFTVQTKSVMSSVFEFLGADKDFTCDHERCDRNATDGRLRDTSAAQLLRRVVPTGIRSRVPPKARRAIRGLVKTKRPIDVQIQDAFAPGDLARLKADSAAFLDYCGKPQSFWKFD